MRRVFEQVKAHPFYDTLRHTSNYFLAQVVFNLLSIISLPIYTSYLSTADFGVVGVFDNLAKSLMILMPLNMYMAISRYLYEPDKTDKAEFLGGAILLSLGLFGVSGVFLGVFSGRLAGWVNVPLNVVLWLIPMTFCNIIYSVYNLYHIALHESFKQARMSVIVAYGRFLGALIFLQFMVPYMGRIVGDVVFFVGVAMYMLYSMWGNVRWVVRKAHVWYMVSYSVPLMVSTLSGFVLIAFDQLYINKTLGNTDAGLYSYATKIGMLMWGFANALNNATQPDFFRWMNEGDTEKINKQTISVLKLMVLAGCFLVFFAADMGKVLSRNREFDFALSLIPIIVVGYFFMGVNALYARLIYYSRRIIYLSMIALTAAILNGVLNFVFVPKYGYFAAGYTTMVSYLFMWILGGMVTARLTPGKLPPLAIVLKYVLLFCVLTGVYLLSVHYGVLNSTSMWVLKVGAFLALGASMYFAQLKRQFLRSGRI